MYNTAGNKPADGAIHSQTCKQKSVTFPADQRKFADKRISPLRIPAPSPPDPRGAVYGTGSPWTLSSAKIYWQGAILPVTRARLRLVLGGDL